MYIHIRIHKYIIIFTYLQELGIYFWDLQLGTAAKAQLGELRAQRPAPRAASARSRRRRRMAAKTLARLRVQEGAKEDPLSLRSLD